MCVCGCVCACDKIDEGRDVCICMCDKIEAGRERTCV